MRYNSDWSQRQIDKKISATELLLAKEYKKASNNAKAEISSLFEKYGKEGQLSYSEMTKYNRLNSLYTNIQEELYDSFGIISKDIKGLVADAYEAGYYQHGFILANQVGLNLNFGLIPTSAIKALINEPNVSGESLLTTLQKTRYNLLLKERQSMVQGFINGSSYDDMAKNIAEVFNKSFNDALRIVRTEGTRAANYGEVDMIDDAKDMGIKLDTIWVATLDRKTRDAHADLDGQIADDEGYFHYHGMTAKCPGDWGEASMDINCRCNIITQPSGEKPSVRRSNLGDKEIIEYKTYREWEAEQKKS